jgi:LmbE family N-acetylglucosaminyl deacetylase
MQWIYLSPHLDDVALSCGGLLWEQAQAGDQVSVWTICAGDPPPGALSPFAQELHTRWETGPEATALRRSEDQLACQRLGATARHFAWPDCIYRQNPQTGKYLYASEEAIFGSLDPSEAGRVSELRQEIGRALTPSGRVVCPLALGGHVDHRLVRAAVQGLDFAFWYYADYPYVLQAGAELQARLHGLTQVSYPISTSGLQAWVSAVAAHASQISTFWPDLAAMRAAMHAYCQQMGGVSLWQPVD